MLNGKVMIICLIARLIKKYHHIKWVVIQNLIVMEETK